MKQRLAHAAALVSLLTLFGVGCGAPSTPADPLVSPTEKPAIPPEAKNVPLPAAN